MFDKVNNSKNEVLTPNPLTSKEEADNYIENGAVPIIGLSAGPGGNVIKGENVQKAVKTQYEAVGAYNMKQLNKKAEMSGYSMPNYSSDIDFNCTRPELDNRQFKSDFDNRQFKSDFDNPPGYIPSNKEITKMTPSVFEQENPTSKQEEFNFDVPLEKYDNLVKKIATMQERIDQLELMLKTFKSRFKNFLDNTSFGEEY